MGEPERGGMLPRKEAQSRGGPGTHREPRVTCVEFNPVVYCQTLSAVYMSEQLRRNLMVPHILFNRRVTVGEAMPVIASALGDTAHRYHIETYARWRRPRGRRGVPPMDSYASQSGTDWAHSTGVNPDLCGRHSHYIHYVPGLGRHTHT